MLNPAEHRGPETPAEPGGPEAGPQLPAGDVHLGAARGAPHPQRQPLELLRLRLRRQRLQVRRRAARPGSRTGFEVRNLHLFV